MSGKKPPTSSHTCATCNKVFSKKSFLKRHIRYMHENKQEDCQFCNRSFRTKSNRKRHEDVVHRQIKRHVCQDCGEGFASKYQISGHRRDSHNVEKLKCHMCNKSFSYASNLRQHQQICSAKPKEWCRCSERWGTF